LDESVPHSRLSGLIRRGWSLGDFACRKVQRHIAGGLLVLSGPITEVSNDNSSATLEVGEKEPAKGMAKASLWYQWTAPAKGLVRMLAEGDGFVPVICVYRGTSLKKLTSIATSLNVKLTANVFCSFQVKAGDTYVMSVDGLYPDGRGSLVFGVDLTTLQITNPLPGATISVALPPIFTANVPLASVDSTLQSVTKSKEDESGLAPMVCRQSREGQGRCEGEKASCSDDPLIGLVIHCRMKLISSHPFPCWRGERRKRRLSRQ
jgi:hypothetical protein